jgi:hypothetical protein
MLIGTADHHNVLALQAIIPRHYIGRQEMQDRAQVWKAVDVRPS